MAGRGARGASLAPAASAHAVVVLTGGVGVGLASAIRWWWCWLVVLLPHGLPKGCNCNGSANLQLESTHCKRVKHARPGAATARHPDAVAIICHQPDTIEDTATGPDRQHTAHSHLVTLQDSSGHLLVQYSTVIRNRRLNSCTFSMAASFWQVSLTPVWSRDSAWLWYRKELPMAGSEFILVLHMLGLPARGHFC